jgi:glycosyltransferase involved in cell wall biosynthesis
MRHLNPVVFELYLAAPEGPMLELFRPLCRTVVTLKRGYVPLSFGFLAYGRAIYATVVNAVRLRRFVRDCPVDLIFTNTSVIFHGVLTAWISRIPSVTMIHELIAPAMLRAVLFRMLLRFNQRVIVMSWHVLKALHVQKESSQVVKIFGMSEPHTTVAGAQESGAPVLPDNVPLVGLVGTVHPIKGHDYFLRMAAEVVRRIPRVMFIVVGPYDARSGYYRRLIRFRHQLGLDDQVIFTGLIEPIHAVMARVNLLVVSSTTESLSLVSVEAMAAGKPVVAFDVGGVSEVVVDGVTGRLVPFGDCRAMADAVCSLLEDPQAAARMGAAGRVRVEKEFNAADQCAKIESVLKEILSGSAQGERTAMIA